MQDPKIYPKNKRKTKTISRLYHSSSIADKNIRKRYLVKNHQAGNKFHLINTKAKALYNALMDLA